MIDDLLDIRVFVSVAATGSLSSAARAMNMSLAAVSKRLAALERRLGVVLMHRTTRSQSLTPEGQLFLQHCNRILNEVQSAETLIAVSQKSVSGRLTISAPQTFGIQHLAPLVAEFHCIHPDLDIRLLFGEEQGDVVGNGVDLCFRFGLLADSTLTARPIAPNYLMLCASPEYLQRCGWPTSIAGLIEHACIVQGSRAVQSWNLQVDGQLTPIDIRAKFIVNDAETAQVLAQRGVGICLASVWDVARQLDVGRLLPVLPECTVSEEPVQVVFPSGRQIAPRVRHFLEFAIERLRATKTWQRDGVLYSKPVQAMATGATKAAAQARALPGDCPMAISLA